MSAASAPEPPAGPLALLGRRPWHVGLAAFVAGLLLAEARPAVVLALALALAALFAGLGLRQLAVLGAALLVGGFALGDSRLVALDADAARVADGEHVVLRAYLLTAPRPNAVGSSAEVGVRGGRLDGVRLLVRAARWAPLSSLLEVGSELQLEGQLQALRAPSDRGRSRDPPFDYSAYLRRRGVAGELLLDRVRSTGRRRGGLAGVLDGARARAERAVAAGLSARQAALLRGMVLGQDEEIDPVTRDDWRAAGLAHLLAVSGQNVMLLAALALPLLMLGGVGLRGRLIALAVLIALYVPLAGAGPSLQRAGVTGLAAIAAMAASRPASRWYTLLLAAAATLAWNPRAAEDPGWQLSFAAVVGILVLGLPLQRLLRKAVDGLAEEAPPGARAPALRLLALRLLALRLLALRALADGVAITLSATLATAGLLAHHFGSVPLAGLAANLLALPAVAPVMWIGMLETALGQLGGFGDPVAAGLGRVVTLPLGYLTALAERAADAPGGQVALPLASPESVAAAYGLLGVLALLARRRARAFEAALPAVAACWGAEPRARRRAIAAAAAATVVVALAVWAAAPAPPDRLTIRFLDVGQGDAVLIQHPDGTAVLFDGGPPEGGVAGLLRRAGVKRLGVVVATHASRDHHAGLLDVLERFPVDILVDGGDGTDDPSFHALLELAAARGVRRVKGAPPLDLALAGGDLHIRILSPPPRPPGPPPEDPNPRAIVAIVSSNGFDLLLSADAESEALLPLELPDVDAMKVPHHGSDDPGLPDVLARAKPELAAIEVGPNTYGHPSPPTLSALRRAKIPAFRTDQDGTITVTPDQDGLHVATER